jgi:hypothetical protein
MAPDEPADPPKLALRKTAPGRVSADGPSAGPDPNGAFAHLQTNRSARKSLDEVVAAGPVSQPHRARNYALVLLLGNLAMVGLFLVLPRSVLIAVPLLSGMVLFSIGLTWSVWVVQRKR